MTELWRRCFNFALLRTVLLKIRYPTFKHVLFILLCGWAMWVQMTYRVPSRFLFLVVPWIGIALTLVSFLILANHLLGRAVPEDQVRRSFQRLQRWADYLILAFVGYSALLFVNGRLDSSAPVEQKSEIIDIVEVRDDFLRYVPYSWIDLRSWEDPARVERVFWQPWVDSNLWPRQPVVVRLREGFFGIPWVMAVSQDEEAHALRMLRIAPTAAGAWKQLVRFYLERKQWHRARKTAEQYFAIYPNDLDAVLAWAIELNVARQWNEMIALVEPIVNSRPHYRLYNLYGWILGQRRNPHDAVRAIEVLQAAIQMEPDSHMGYYHLGFILSWNGQPDAALAIFDKLHTLRPGIPDVDHEVTRLRKQLEARESRAQHDPAQK